MVPEVAVFAIVIVAVILVMIMVVIVVNGSTCINIGCGCDNFGSIGNYGVSVCVRDSISGW